MKRDFLTVTDFSEEEIRKNLALALEIKKKRQAEQSQNVLKGGVGALIFHKPSLRTRCSFEVGFRELGGSAVYITGKEIDLGKGPIFSSLVKLGGPVMLSLLFTNIYYLVDTIFVSWAGTLALAALSLAIPVFYFALAIVKGIADGTTSLLGEARGSCDSKAAEEITRASFPLLLLLLSPFLLLLVPAFCNRFTAMLGATATVITESYRYIFWLVVSFPVRVEK